VVQGPTGTGKSHSVPHPYPEHEGKTLSERLDSYVVEG